jgi:hypothetical protein
MPIIYSYPSDTPEKNDIVLGTKQSTNGNQSNSTKNFTVKSIVDAGLTSDALLFKDVGLTFTTGQDYKALTNRTDGSFPTNCKYEKLKIDFSNLTLEPGYTYKLVIERWKKGSLRDSNDFGSNKRTGYRALGSAANDGMNPPFSQRPGAITITSTTGQLFDFRPDLYYSSGTGNKGFPKLSGQCKQSWNRKTSTQFFQFRISRTNASGNTVLSPALAQLKLIGFSYGGVNRITWSAL